MSPTARPWRSPVVRATALLVALVAACGGGDPPPPDHPPRAAAQDLAVAVGDDPFLRPLRTPAAGTDSANPDIGLRSDGPNPGIFETLTRVTPAFGVAPGLAERWEAVSPTRWRFVLRSGVTFHDGSPLEAGAVVESLETVARRQNRPRGLEPGSVRAVDERTVEVALTHPNLRLPEQLADPSAGIRALGTVAGAGDGGSDTPTGTGPFAFSSYVPGDRLALTAYDGYWGGRPQLDSLSFLFGPPGDASRRLATREALAVGHVPHAALARVSDPDRRVASAPARSAYLLLNVGGAGKWATLQDERIRRAVALAIDREAVTEAAWPDHGQANDTLIPPSVLDVAAGGVAAPAHDLAAAGDLLDDAGWTRGAGGVRQRDGQALELTMILARSEKLQVAAEAIRGQLAAAGIASALVDPGDGPADRYGTVNQGTFDLFLDLRAQSDANPCALCRFFTIRPGGQLTISGTVGAGAAADAHYEEAFTASSTDGARRSAAELMAVVVAEEVVAVPLATLSEVWLVSGRLQGFDPAAVIGAQRWDSVWLAE